MSCAYAADPLPDAGMTVLLRTAESATAGGDPARAAETWQRLIEEGRQRPVLAADGSVRGASALAAERLRASAAEPAWHQRYDLRAEAALAGLAGCSDPLAFARLAERWPLAPAAAQARLRAADLFAMRAEWHLALAAVLGLEAGQTRAVRAQAALSIPVQPSMRVVAGVEDASASAADGSLRWRLAADRSPGAAAPSGGVAPALAAEGGIALLRLRRNGAARLLAVAGDSGRVRWSSADVPELADLAAVGAPCLVEGRCWAVFSGGGRTLVAGLDAADGRVLWTCPLGPPAAGEAPAPVLCGTLVVCANGAGLVAGLDAATGSLRWLHTVPDAVLGGPIPGDGRIRIPIAGATLELDAATGREIGRGAATPIAAAPVPSPLKEAAIVDGAVQPCSGRPLALAAAWELPLGPARAIAVSGDETFIIAGATLTRIAAGTGAVTWAVAVPVEGLATLRIDGEAVVATLGGSRLTCDRAGGRIISRESGPDAVVPPPPPSCVLGDRRISCVTAGRSLISIAGLDGPELFRVDATDAWRRTWIGVVGLGDQALAIADGYDGHLRGLLVDPQQGVVTVSSPLPGTVASPALPPAIASGTVVIGTMRGFTGVVPVTAPPALAPWAQAPLPITVAAPPRIDGRLDDWAAAPSWTAPGGLQVRASRDDAALRFALELPGMASRPTLLVVDAGEGGLLLVALDWADGVPVARVLRAPDGDGRRQPVTARATLLAGLVWEVAIPWPWLGARSGTDRILRAGVAAWLADGRTLEWGDGLVRGLDPARLVRLR